MKIRRAYQNPYGFSLVAHAVDDHGDLEEVGQMQVKHSGFCMRVDVVEVEQGMQRRGIGTKLYQAAARLACKVYKKPLCSSVERSVAAEAFWRKQVLKKRAVRVRNTKSDFEREGMFKLRCPPPASLGRIR